MGLLNSTDEKNDQTARTTNEIAIDNNATLNRLANILSDKIQHISDYGHICWFVGDNTDGQFGSGNTTPKIIKTLTAMKNFPKNNYIKDIVTGRHGSTYFLCQNNNIIVCGYNFYEQLSVSVVIMKLIISFWNKYQHIPSDLLNLIVTYIDEISFETSQVLTPLYLTNNDTKYISRGICSNHKFIITNNNSLYGMGWNQYNQLGIDSGRQIKRCLTHVKYFKDQNIKIKQIDCSYVYSTFLSAAGNVYTCTGSTIHMLNIQYEVSYIASGERHTLAIVNNGNLMSWGENAYGQLGIGDVGDLMKRARYYKPQILPYFHDKNVTIIQIGVGGHHNIALDANGGIICFGRNDMYQCMPADYHYVPLPKYLITNMCVVDVKCGLNHNVIKTNSNEYYLWGDNKYNQCLIDNADVKVAKLILFDKEYFHGKYEIISIFPGYNETRIVTTVCVLDELEHK
eukprot:102697_1